MNKTNLQILKNQISEKKSKINNKMTIDEYLMNKDVIDDQVENMDLEN